MIFFVTCQATFGELVYDFNFSKASFANNWNMTSPIWELVQVWGMLFLCRGSSTNRQPHSGEQRRNFALQTEAANLTSWVNQPTYDSSSTSSLYGYKRPPINHQLPTGLSHDYLLALLTLPIPYKFHYLRLRTGIMIGG